MLRSAIILTTLSLVGILFAAPPEHRAADRTAVLEEQARLVQQADQLRRDGKPQESRDAVARAVDLEKGLFAEPTHALLYLSEHLAAAHDRCKDADAARKTRMEALAVQQSFLGDHPGKSLADETDRLRQALEVREKALGPKHRLVGLTLVDLALAQEEAGDLDGAQASLVKAVDLFKAAPNDFGLPSPGHLPDSQYQLDRIRLSAKPAAGAVPDESARRLNEARGKCDEAEAAEARGDLAAARDLYTKAVTGGYQGFGGTALTGDEQALAETAAGYHAVLGRFLSFAARNGIPDKDVSRDYDYLCSYKGSVFTRALVTRLERHHPTLNAFCQAYEDVSRRLAAQGNDARPDETRSLRARRDALEAEMVRRRGKLPQYMPAAPTTMLPAGAALVDYLVYDYAPLPAVEKDKPPPERRLACFVSRPKTAAAYVDLGAVAPVDEAIGVWRRALANPESGGRGAKRRPLPGDGDPDAARRILRERLWAPLLPHLDKADVVLISPDGPLALIPFAALPGDKPGTYLLEERPLAVAPVPRLLTPLHSEADFLARRGDWASVVALPPEADAAPLLVGDVDFAARLTTETNDSKKSSPAPGDLEGTFPPLPGTAQEIEAVGDLFEKLSPGKRCERLTGKGAAKAAVCTEAPTHRWLHLATHGYFQAEAAAGGADLPELRSALALAGASAPGGRRDGVLTALETASLDLDQVDLAVLSACETGLGDVREGEGVLGLQRAFLAAGARTTVTSLWQVDDEGTRALMVEFYRNLWERKLDKLESLRQAQLAMLRGDLYRPPSSGRNAGQPPRLPPFYWAAFTLSGDWR